MSGDYDAEFIRIKKRLDALEADRTGAPKTPKEVDNLVVHTDSQEMLAQVRAIVDPFAQRLNDFEANGASTQHRLAALEDFRHRFDGLMGGGAPGLQQNIAGPTGEIGSNIVGNAGSGRPPDL